MLISCAVTIQLICAFVFAYANGRFSHDMAHVIDAAISIGFLRICDSLQKLILKKVKT